MSGGTRDPAEERLVVFGATGTTGTHVVRQALDEGVAVRAAVRSPEKLSVDLVNHERLEVAKLSITDDVAVGRAIAGTTMVFTALGYTGRPARPVMLPFVHQVVRSMREHGVRRLVYQGSGLIPVPGQPNPLHLRLLRPLVGWAVGASALWNEHEAVIRFLVEEASDLDWTVTRPGQLSDGASKGRLVVSKTTGGGVIYRDLAAFSLEAARTGAYARTCPYLRYA